MARSAAGSCEWRMYWLTMSTLARYSRAEGSASAKNAVTDATKTAYMVAPSSIEMRYLVRAQGRVRSGAACAALSGRSHAACGSGSGLAAIKTSETGQCAEGDWVRKWRGAGEKRRHGERVKRGGTGAQVDLSDGLRRHDAHRDREELGRGVEEGPRPLHVGGFEGDARAVDP